MSEYNINKQYTLLERAKTSIDGKTVLPAVDVMDKMGVGEFIQDVPFFECNSGLKHRISRTTDRPTSTRPKFYGGTRPNMSTEQVLFEPCVEFTQRSEIDERLLKTIKNGEEMRRQKDMPHAAGIIDDFVYDLFNSVRTSGSEYINGLSARLGTISNPYHTTTSLPYVWDNGGTDTGNLTSLYIVEWGPQAVHCLYPDPQVRGEGTLGMSIRNEGREPIKDANDSLATYYAMVTTFSFWFGLAVWNDWKIARIANIHYDEKNSGALNDNIIIKALRHGKFNRGATRIYGNAFIGTQIDIRAKDKGNTFWGTTEVFGKEINQIQGIPFRMLDDTIITNTETLVS